MARGSLDNSDLGGTGKVVGGFVEWRNHRGDWSNVAAHGSMDRSFKRRKVERGNFNGIGLDSFG